MSIYCQNVQVYQRDLIQVLDNDAGDLKRESDKVFLSSPSILYGYEHICSSLKILFKEVTSYLCESHSVST